MEGQHCQMVAFLIVIIAGTFAENSRTRHIGCYKMLSKESVCATDHEKITENIDNAAGKALEWLRQQQQHTGLWFSPDVTGAVLWHIATTGYIHDGGICSDTIKRAQGALNKIMLENHKSITKLNGGKLALVVLGLHSICVDVHNFHGKNLVHLLRKKMKAFPKRDFNNFYQYSLGIIALHVTGNDISSDFSEKLLQDVFHKKHNMSSAARLLHSDTRAMALVALEAVRQQKFQPHWSRKHSERQVEKGMKFVRRHFAKERDNENFVTLTHQIQFHQAHRTKMGNNTVCTNLFKRILANRDETGSFGGIMETAYVLPVLARQSLLRFHKDRCITSTKDEVDEEAVDEYIVENQIPITTPAPKYSNKHISVELRIEFEDPHMGVDPKPLNLLLLSGSTALEALEKAATINKCYRSKHKETVWGPFLESICQVEQNHGKRLYWMFSVNGKMANTGAGKYVLRDNDIIKFRYQSVKTA